MSCKIYTRNIYGRYGDSKLPIKLKFKDAQGVPKDISNFNFIIQIKDKNNNIIAQASTVGGGVQQRMTLIKDAANHLITWGFVESGQTALTIDPGVYKYAIKLIDGSNPTTIIQGEFIVEPEIVDTVLIPIP